MTKDEIRAKVLEILGGIAPEVDLAALRTDRPLREQVELDSFDTLQLMVRVSKGFGVEIPEAVYGKMRTIDELVEHVSTGVGAR